MKKTTLGLAIAASLSLLSACSDNNSGNSNILGDSDNSLLAFVAARDADWASGHIERFSITAGDMATGSFVADKSDIDVRTYGDHVYQLGRYTMDYLMRLDADDTAAAGTQYSVVDSSEASLPNPYDIAFVSDTKAYLIRYGSPKVWIINPTAATEAEFKLGELDLSAYDSDGVPEANAAVIVDDKLFVLMERLETFSPVKAGYIAVFDTATDSEITTGMGDADGLPGIALNVLNPTALQYSADGDSLYVVGRGNYFAMDDSLGDRYSGGIERIDPTSYAHAIIVDDGDESSNSGFFNDLVVVDAAQAYVTTYRGYQDNAVHRVDLSGLTLETAAVAGLENIDITALALDPINRLWVGLSGDQPGFTLINTADDSVENALLPTELTPMHVEFLDRR